jgi:predicted nucleic acid-binding Zn ribbon protein
MPIREYVCKRCGRREDVIERDGRKKTAPACPGHGRMRKAAPRVAPAQFKGSGFYVTDYGGKSEGREG